MLSNLNVNPIQTIENHLKNMRYTQHNRQRFNIHKLLPFVYLFDVTRYTTHIQRYRSKAPPERNTILCIGIAKAKEIITSPALPPREALSLFLYTYIQMKQNVLMLQHT